MKYFISQPMRDKTDDEIKMERNMIIDKIQKKDSEAEILDSFFEGAPHDAKPLWFLGKSFEVLSNADVLYLAKGWEEARGCKMEHDAAIAYGIPVIEYNN